MCTHHSNGQESEPKFKLGRIVGTRNALAEIPRNEIQSAIERHVRGDWGTLDRHDWEENERSLKRGGRLFSVYLSKRGIKFYIITEWDRSVTTVLLPEDY